MPSPSLKQTAAEHQLPLATVAVEVLHLAILESLFSRSESRIATFQGGTSIHLLHGGYRFSEDLDFAGADLNWDAAENLLKHAQAGIEKLVMQLLGHGLHEWRLPEKKKPRRIYAAWYAFQPRSERQKFRVKIEFAHYPVYNSQPLPAHSELQVAQRAPLVNGLPPEELMAEKLAAVAGRAYVKGRDLFDLWYFREVLKTAVDVEMVRHKFRDYNVGITPSALRDKLKAYSQDSLAAEMNRFLPARYRRMLEKNGYQLVRASAEQAVQQALTQGI
ncbi:MAG: nucleotidyl transferase AbiEii/AbiGii toxin family protein [candidate division KSB1 bacterium]